MSDNKEKKKKFNFYWIYAILGVFILGNLLFNTLGTGSKKLNYDQFKEVAAYNFIQKVVIVITVITKQVISLSTKLAV